MERDLITTRALLSALFAAGLVSALARAQALLVLGAAIDLLRLAAGQALCVTTFDGAGLFTILAILVDTCLQT